MTTICWDGHTLTADSKSSRTDESGQCRSLKIYELDEPMYLSTVGGTVIYALAGSGMRSAIEMAYGCINEYAKDRVTVDEWLRISKRFDTSIVKMNEATILLVGKKKGKPFCGKLYHNRVEEFAPGVIGVKLEYPSVISKVVKNSLEAVHLITLLHRKQCGPDYFRFNPMTRKLIKHTPAEIQTERLVDDYLKALEEHFEKIKKASKNLLKGKDHE